MEAAVGAGQLELNVMMPVIAYNLLQEIAILKGASAAFTSRCVEGIEANMDVCQTNAERSPAVATALNPAIGYEKAAELAKDALEKNISVRELALQRNLLDHDELERLLDLRGMTEDPGAE